MKESDTLTLMRFRLASYEPLQYGGASWCRRRQNARSDQRPASDSIPNAHPVRLCVWLSDALIHCVDRVTACTLMEFSGVQAS